MSCQATQETRKRVMSNDSPVICRGDNYCSNTTVKLEPGVYPAYTPLKWLDESTNMAGPLEAHTDKIMGVLTCAQDLSAETAACEVRVLCDAVFDTNMINWPESFTVEHREVIESRSTKPCFRSRIGCIETPEWVE